MQKCICQKTALLATCKEKKSCYQSSQTIGQKRQWTLHREAMKLHRETENMFRGDLKSCKIQRSWRLKINFYSNANTLLWTKTPESDDKTTYKLLQWKFRIRNQYIDSAATTQYRIINVYRSQSFKIHLLLEIICFSSSCLCLLNGKMFLKIYV